MTIRDMMKRVLESGVPLDTEVSVYIRRGDRVMMSNKVGCEFSQRMNAWDMVIGERSAFTPTEQD